MDEYKTARAARKPKQKRFSLMFVLNYNIDHRAMECRGT